MNLGELKDKVIEKLRERSTPKHWTATEIVGNINRGCREFAKIARPRMQRLPLVPVDLAYGRFDFPLRLLLKDGVYWNNTKLRQVTEEYFDNLYGNNAGPMEIGISHESPCDWRAATADNPTHWLIDDGMIRLFPIPLSMSSAVSIRQVQQSTLLAATTDVTFTGPLPSNQNLIDLYLNGVYQNKDQWSVINTTTIRMVGTLPVDCDAEIVFFDGVSSANTNTFKYTLSLPAGVQVVNLPRPYIVGDSALSVKINGVSQAPSAFTESSSYSITLAAALVVDSCVEVTIYERAGAFPATMKCQRIPTEMVNDTDVPDLPSHLEDFHDAIWMWALVECFSREGQEKDMGMAQFYSSLFARRLSEYKESFGAPIAIANRDAWRI